MLSQAERKMEHRQINDNMTGSVFERLIRGEVRRFHFETLLNPILSRSSHFRWAAFSSSRFSMAS
jgi:hypothetical protein